MTLSRKPSTAPLAHRSQAEVAARLGITKSRVDQIERAALRKLAAHPLLRQLAQDEGWIAGEGDE